MKKKFDAGAAVRSNSRDRIGPVPPTVVQKNLKKKLKRKKTKEILNEESKLG